MKRAFYQQALEGGLFPIYEPGDTFQQDNARIHTSYSTQEFLEENGIWIIEWPPYSPDINPIEHL
jgi:tRNA A37 threonylcarbamoyladenosine biosynthesis protein TsaE